MGAPTKKEKFIKANFNIDEDGEGFVFTPKEDSKLEIEGSVKIENVGSLKEASLMLYESIHQEKTKPNNEVIAERQLEDLASKYPTDKLQHGYLTYYAKHLDPKTDTILEIGCYEGNSVRMWREFFSEETRVLSLDLFVDNPVPNIDGVDFFTGSQSDEDILDLLESFEPTVIIDDGSHGAKDQWLVVEKFLKPGRLVIIEDLHCNFDGNGFWNQGLAEGETILGKIKSGEFNYNHKVYLDKIVFIWG